MLHLRKNGPTSTKWKLNSLVESHASNMATYFARQTLFAISQEKIQLSRDEKWIYQLTFKHRVTHGCIVSSTVVTDALVLKHETTSIHNADEVSYKKYYT